MSLIQIIVYCPDCHQKEVLSLDKSRLSDPVGGLYVVSIQHNCQNKPHTMTVHLDKEFRVRHRRCAPLLHSRTSDLTEKMEFNVYFFGLDFAGKTTMVNYWQQKTYTPARSATQSLELYQIEINGIKLQIYDLPGQKIFQKFLWPSVFKTLKPDVLLFYISVAKKEERRWSEAFKALKKVLDATEEKFGSACLPVGVVANKIDLIPEKRRADVFNRFYLSLRKIGIWDQLSNICSAYRIFETSSLTGEGVEAVLEWLTTDLLDNP
ncbi:MAG: ADP-ribosylation factor-like protein [Candidatus Hodarchaeota archaeon]